MFTLSALSLILRGLIFLYLYIHLIRTWYVHISLPTAIIIFMFVYIYSVFLNSYTQKLNRILRCLLLLSFIVQLELIRGIVFLVDIANSSNISTFIVQWDISYLPLRFMLVSIFYSTILFLNLKQYRLIETILRLLLFITIFWNMRQFKLGIYPNLVSLLISLIIFYALELTLLSRLLISDTCSVKTSLKTFIFSILTATLVAPWIYKKASPYIKNHSSILKNYLNSLDVDSVLSLESEVILDSDLLFIIHNNNEDLLPQNLLLKRLTFSEYTQEGKFISIKNLDDEFNSENFNYHLWESHNNFENNNKKNIDFYLINISPHAIISPYVISEYKELVFDNQQKFKKIFRIKYQNFPIEKHHHNLQKSILPDELKEWERIYHDTSNISLEIKNLAKDITQTFNTDYEKLEALNNYFHDNFYYTLNPGLSLNNSQLDYFLFHSKKGYCTYFATAMALMARSLGMVSRVAGGFLLNTDNSILDFYAVTEAEAHTWVEVYLEESGWIVFDPTPSRIYNNELILISNEHTMNEMMNFAQDIYYLQKEQKRSNIELNIFSKNTYIKIILNLVLLLIIIVCHIILFKLIFIKIFLNPSPKNLQKILSSWMILLNYPTEKTWNSLLNDNNKAKNIIKRVQFSRNKIISEEELCMVQLYLKTCYMAFKKLPLSTKITRIFYLFTWKFKNVFQS